MITAFMPTSVPVHLLLLSLYPSHHVCRIAGGGSRPFIERERESSGGSRPLWEEETAVAVAAAAALVK